MCHLHEFLETITSAFHYVRTNVSNISAPFFLQINLRDGRVVCF